ncbi:1-acyl-sn-glycerol-3-phosphate acyltransferase [Ferruginibacter sp.]
MLYSFVKIIARLAIKIYCRNITINKKEILQQNGPLLLAVNHPNSFLDAIIFCTLFDRPVYSLARGDAFKKTFAAKILYSFKILPVYRVSEGVENLEENYKTFEECKKIFKQNGIVLIFSEGRCINEWHLRPLKKGTARLAISSWQDGIDLKVLPVAINYSSFKKFGKNVKIFFGNFITATSINLSATDGKAINSFNTILEEELKSFVFEIKLHDKEALQKNFYIPQSLIKKISLALPAAAGFIIHAPFYYAVKLLGNTLIKEEGHFDSKMVGLLFFLYPLYLLTLFVICFVVTDNWWSILLMLITPFAAWSYVQLKEQLD